MRPLYTFGVMQVKACINVDIFVAHGWWLLMVTDKEFIYKACTPCEWSRLKNLTDKKARKTFAFYSLQTAGCALLP